MGEEYEEEREVDEEDDLVDSDTDTAATVDSLFENVKFPEDKEEEVKEKTAKPKINLGELVKQDLRKIVTSVEYFDEEKFEGGKKIKSFHKKQKDAAEAAKASETEGAVEKTEENKTDSAESDQPASPPSS